MVPKNDCYSPFTLAVALVIRDENLVENIRSRTKNLSTDLPKITVFRPLEFHQFLSALLYQKEKEKKKEVKERKANQTHPMQITQIKSRHLISMSGWNFVLHIHSTHFTSKGVCRKIGMNGESRSLGEESAPCQVERVSQLGRAKIRNSRA